jgi:hypothetical protein
MIECQGRDDYDRLLDKVERDALIAMLDVVKAYIAEHDNPNVSLPARGHLLESLREAVKLTDLRIVESEG